MPSPHNFEKKRNFMIDKVGEKGKNVKSNFEYSSGKNKKFLNIKEIRELNTKYLK